MSNYSGLTKAQLIAELNARDNTVTDLNQIITNQTDEISTLQNQVGTKDEEIILLNQTLNDKDIIIEERTTEIQNLNQIVGTMRTPTGVLVTISSLEKEAKKELTHKVRTTKEGIQAFMDMNYGLSKPEILIIIEDA